MTFDCFVHCVVMFICAQLWLGARFFPFLNVLCNVFPLKQTSIFPWPPHTLHHASLWHIVSSNTLTLWLCRFSISYLYITPCPALLLVCFEYKMSLRNKKSVLKQKFINTFHRPSGSPAAITLWFTTSQKLQLLKCDTLLHLSVMLLNCKWNILS